MRKCVINGHRVTTLTIESKVADEGNLLCMFSKHESIAIMTEADKDLQGVTGLAQYVVAGTPSFVLSLAGRVRFSGRTKPAAYEVLEKRASQKLFATGRLCMKYRLRPTTGTS